ncbi:telomere-binding protein cav [Drosophila subpulchrella]|uniref:telomere-binding protein cav n=1 Tax=Drosophila subpulchrella TaxID=1486046 RepID=UPI0018A18757|nr:telomere-binding protein cav [Drosophila subpulchrella]
MPGMEMSDYLRKFLADEDESIREICKDPECDGKMIMWMHNKTRITEQDLAREYTADEVRELCLRTKIRVNMTLYNCLWDAKKRFDAKNRLENKSEKFINGMYLKAVRKKMVGPYPKDYIANHRDVVRAQTKKLNNHRLDRWHGKKSNMESAPDWESPENLDSPVIQGSEDTFGSTFDSDDKEEESPQKAPAMPNAVAEPSVAAAPADQDESLEEALELSSVSGIGDQEGEKDQQQPQPASHLQDVNCPATQMDESWVRFGVQINSESMSIGESIDSEDYPSTQNSEPDYQTFNTQVTASTQESAK